MPELAAAVPASATPPRAMDSLAVLVLPAKLVRATSDNPKSIPCPASKYPMPYLLACQIKQLQSSLQGGKWTSNAGATKIVKNCTRCACRLACIPSDPCTGLKLLLAGQLIVEPAPNVQCVGHLDQRCLKIRKKALTDLQYNFLRNRLLPQNPASPAAICQERQTKTMPQHTLHHPTSFVRTLCHHPELHLPQ